MNTELKSDLARLRVLAFQRYKRCGLALRTFHRLRRKIDASPDANLTWTLYHWLLVPLSLWPVDIAGLAHHVLKRISKGKALDRELTLLLEMLSTAPLREACEVMGVYEHSIAKGSYERLVKCQQKFDERESRLRQSKEFRSAWKRMKSYYDIPKYRLKRGVIRRQMSQERNFRDGLTFSWRSKHGRFLALFDVLCYRWNLYGVQYDRPLLLKITVNPTPHGTMIFIPRYWSIDSSRDLNWKEIGRLHHAHGAIRQGPKLSVSRMALHEEAIVAQKAWDEARKNDVRGDKRYEYVLAALGKPPESDFSTVKRLLRKARKPS